MIYWYIMNYEDVFKERRLKYILYQPFDRYIRDYVLLVFTKLLPKSTRISVFKATKAKLYYNMLRKIWD